MLGKKSIWKSSAEMGVRTGWGQRTVRMMGWKAKAEAPRRGFMRATLSGISLSSGYIDRCAYIRWLVEWANDASGSWQICE